MSDERYEKGMQTRREVLGDAYVDRALAAASAFSQPLQELVTAHAWGTAWQQQALPRPTRSLVTLGILVALRASHEIATHVRGALRNGCSVEEVRDALLHATVYCGVPAGVEAFRAAAPVVEAWLAGEGREA
ncbi:MAG TPA: carboxymuconolactone decarboxylase family protein [Gammaproteobacteria bacterium]